MASGARPELDFPHRRMRAEARPNIAPQARHIRTDRAIPRRCCSSGPSTPGSLTPDLFRERWPLLDSPALRLSSRAFRPRADCAVADASAAWSHRDGQTERALACRNGRTNFFCASSSILRRLLPRESPPSGGHCRTVRTAGITVLDLNAALVAHLALERPVWMTVFSGNNSLQASTPCRGESEESLHDWFHQVCPPARRLSLDMVQKPVRQDAKRHTPRRRPTINRIPQPGHFMIHNQDLTDMAGLDSARPRQEVRSAAFPDPKKTPWEH